MLNSLTHIYVFVLYFPSFLTISDFLTALECLELMISSLSSKVLLVGDFNAPGFGCVDGCVSDSRCSAVTNFLNILNLSQHNVVYNNLGRLLDLLIADERFYSKLYEIFNLHVPLKKCTTRHYPVWFNSAIITKIRKKSNVLLCVCIM
jgi:hypothetical protein